MLSIFINRWAALLHDILWIPVAIIFSFWLRFNLNVIPDYYWEGIKHLLFIALIVQTICYWYFGLYRGIWRFASIPDILQITKSVALGVGITVICVFLIYRMQTIPRSILILYPLILFLGLSAPRLIYRWFKDKHLYLSPPQLDRVLIIGAGRAGEMLVREILRTNEYEVIGFLDDDAGKLERDIHGVRVLENITNLDKVLNKYSVDVVIVSIRNIDSLMMRSILRTCNEKEIECKTIPSLSEATDDSVDVSRLRNIKLEDLLGRESVKLNDQTLFDFIGGTCVLVTGAGGSIGSELCRQALKYRPDKLIMLEQSEFNLYKIIEDLKEINTDYKTKIISILCDVKDLSNVDEIFAKFKPNIVLHAAAYKHVPIIEENIIEGIKTNVFGTKNLAEISAKYEVEKFVMVSTDKAVNPTSMMGVTKRVAEIFSQALDSQSRTKFITTRFGNVIDSTGSVVPLFREQINKGGPVTVTHKDISRYFMSIPEAVSLILQAASMGHGGEIYVLDMGKPVKIFDLARQMIRLAGYDPDIDINIEFIGLRPGEKLYEELFHHSEEYSGTKHPKILLADSRQSEWQSLTQQIEKLQAVVKVRNLHEILAILKLMVPEYDENQVVQSIDPTNNRSINTLH